MSFHLLDDLHVTVAQTVKRTEAEGPGWRYALWVQGCPMRCVGCCNPEMLSFTPKISAPVMSARAIYEQVMSCDVEGISFLGGEPFSQAEALSVVAHAIRQSGRTVMIFSGYTLEELRVSDAPGVRDLLAHTDLLVDGRYDASKRTTTRRWIGSDNQVMHFLTDRYQPTDSRFYESNHLEIRMRGNEISLNGWPIDGALTRIGRSR
jgi:anaerobic ribonucleoside-triphosphate reductase activating protein